MKEASTIWWVKTIREREHDLVCQGNREREREREGERGRVAERVRE